MSRWAREAALWIGAVVGVMTIVGAVAVIGLGYSLLVFRSGSMEPEISTGALALARTVDAQDIQKGDVVSVKTALGSRVTHRVVDVQLSGSTATLTLKGDANKIPDDETYPVTSAPRVVGSVPALGYAVAQLFSAPGLLLAGAFGALLVYFGVKSDQDQPRGGSRRGSRKNTNKRGRAAVVGAASAVVLVTGVSVTDAAFTDPATATTAASAAPYFTCNSGSSALAPWAYYKFDEAAPALAVAVTAADSSGNNNGAQYRPNYLLVNPPFALGQSRACGRDTGTAVRFNGTSSYVSSSANVANANGAAGNRWNTFTLSVWFKSSSATSSGNLISYGNTQTGSSSSHDRHIYLSSAGNIVFGVYPGAIREVATTGTDYSDTQWHMATAKLSSAGMKLYVDGQPVGSRTDTTTGEQYATAYWRIGYDNVQGWGQATGDYFAGTMDEVGIYNRALSDADVYALYRSAKPNA